MNGMAIFSKTSRLSVVRHGPASSGMAWFGEAGHGYFFLRDFGGVLKRLQTLSC
jgi:hypothetical protein